MGAGAAWRPPRICPNAAHAAPSAVTAPVLSSDQGAAGALLGRCRDRDKSRSTSQQPGFIGTKRPPR